MESGRPHLDHISFICKVGIIIGITYFIKLWKHLGQWLVNVATLTLLLLGNQGGIWWKHLGDLIESSFRLCWWVILPGRLSYGLLIHVTNLPSLSPSLLPSSLSPSLFPSFLPSSSAFSYWITASLIYSKHICKVYNFVSFDVYVKIYISETITKIMMVNIFITSEITSCPSSCFSPLFLFTVPYTQVATVLLSVTIDYFIFSSVLKKWNQSSICFCLIILRFTYFFMY